MPRAVEVALDGDEAGVGAALLWVRSHKVEMPNRILLGRFCFEQIIRETDFELVAPLRAAYGEGEGGMPGMIVSLIADETWYDAVNGLTHAVGLQYELPIDSAISVRIDEQFNTGIESRGVGVW